MNAEINKAAAEPRVSVIMNCLNGEKYLREAIDSVFAQTYTNWEIIFWDNASTDRSPEIAKSYDDRLKYFRGEETVPLGAARNKAMRETRGELIAFLDCDDLWLPHKLQRQVQAIYEGDYSLCYAGIEQIEPNGRLIKTMLPMYECGFMFESLLYQFDINMVTPVLKKDVLMRLNLNFDESITASEEYNLFMRLAATTRFCKIPEVLGKWRISPGSLTDRQIVNWGPEREVTLARIREENPGIEITYRKAFDEAYARGFYYRARYYRSIKDGKKAREAMKEASKKNGKYAPLYFALFFPGLWDLIHMPTMKLKVLPRILWAFKEVRR